MTSIEGNFLAQRDKESSAIRCKRLYCSTRKQKGEAIMIITTDLTTTQNLTTLEPKESRGKQRYGWRLTLFLIQDLTLYLWPLP